MIRSLDRAISEIAVSLPSLRAAVLSAAPDGLIAWCWSRNDEPEIALNFARLDRATADCLAGLGATGQARSLLLTAKDASIVAWPVDEVQAFGGTRLIATLVFAGELQSGMVMVYAQRVLQRIRAVLAEQRDAALREQLIEVICQVDDPAAALERLAANASIDLLRLTRIDSLSPEERRRVGAEASATI